MFCLKFSKSFLICIICSLTIHNAVGRTLIGKVDSLDIASSNGEVHLLKLEDGQVIFMKARDKKNLTFFKDKNRLNHILEFKINSNNDLISVKETGLQALREENDGPYTMPSFEPTIIQDSLTLNNIFKRMRRDNQRNSQCYNRAHVWAWEEFQKTKLNSIKLFLFFTNRYIRNYRYKWWFHVAPMVKTINDDQVLDRLYASKPLTKSQWTKIFIYSRKSCPAVEKYDDYRNNQEVEDCYLIPVSMYFWQPRDILNRDRTGFVKTDFISSELRHAYWEAY